MDTEKQTHVVYLSHVPQKRQTFSLFLHTLTLHVIVFNPLNAELNSIFHLLALLGARHTLHVSRIRVNIMSWYQAFKAEHYLHLHCKVTPKHTA